MLFLAIYFGKVGRLFIFSVCTIRARAAVGTCTWDSRGRAPRDFGGVVWPGFGRGGHYFYLDLRLRKMDHNLLE